MLPVAFIKRFICMSFHHSHKPASSMTTSTPTTPDRGQKKKVRSVAVRTSPRNLATKRKRVVGAGKTKVRKKIVACKALKVKPNLGRASGSKEHNAKK